jgi:hypothetical protein
MHSAIALSGPLNYHFKITQKLVVLVVLEGQSGKGTTGIGLLEDH